MRKKSFIREPGVPFKLFSNSISVQERHYLSYFDLARAAYKICQVFLNSSSQITEAQNRVLFVFMGYSVELSLKAFILCKDYSEEIRNEIKDPARGHNLEYLLIKTKGESLLSLKKEEIKLICKLNKYYKDSGFRYYEDKKSKETLFFLIKPQNVKDYIDIIDKIHDKVSSISKEKLPKTHEKKNY